ncbi:MAG: hypothetical protein JST11_12295 [Acidobacteria bacterium]|nr:hypothetical protein [Acidobacteriota bacterium]
MLAHPVATARGIARYLRGETSPPRPWPGGAGSLVGLGFCLKPLAPACPSGRANHRCAVMDGTADAAGAPCGDCLILALGRQALAGGSAVYIMTSARDILHDVLLPALRHRRFRSAVLAMCRYSFEPMRLALEICGIEARLFPFFHGDCRDYTTWRRADLGEKSEQTLLDESSLRDLAADLAAATGSSSVGFVRVGNIYEPARVGS